MRNKTIIQQADVVSGAMVGYQEAHTAPDRIQHMLAIMELLDTNTLADMAADLAKPDADIAPADLAEWQFTINAELIGRKGD